MKRTSALIVTILTSSAGSAYSQVGVMPTGPYATEEVYVESRRAATVRLDAADVIGLVKAVELSVSDQVSDGCWTNGRAVAARIRAELEGANIPVYEEPLSSNWIFTPILEFSALGYRVGSAGCIGTVSMSVEYSGFQEFGSLAYTQNIFAVPGWVTSWSQRYIVSGGGSLNEQIMEIAQEFVDTLIADIARAGRVANVGAMRAEWEHTSPMTQRERDAMIANWQD